MTLINVRGNTENDDPFYRYKMNDVDIIKQGAKYAFTNINEIAVAINRDPKTIVSFLKKHFGSQFEYKNNIVM